MAPRIVRRNNIDAFNFKDFNTGFQRFAGKGELGDGGFISIRVESPDIAAKILKKYQNDIYFWQVSRSYVIKKGRKPGVHLEGFSKSHTGKQVSSLWVQRALRESGINAVNRTGHDFKYESNAPDFVKPKTKVFTLIIWFNAKQAKRFFPETE